MTYPKQEEVDCVAAFVETTEDLSHEPFMAEDESRKFSSGGSGGEVYHLGDRSHFRSALISFRRLWMNDEPSHYNTVCNILYRHHSDSHFATQFGRENIKRCRKQNPWNSVNLSNEEIIDLWLNCVFIHSGLDNNKNVSRERFDKFVSILGIGKFEYAFRSAVWQLCLNMISICNLSARVALEDWSAKVKPSFLVSSPFGRKMKERIADGTVIIRQASTKYYNEETLDRRFYRILERQGFNTLNFFFQQLDASANGKALLALQASGIRDILNRLEYTYRELPEVENQSWADFPDMKAASGVGPVDGTLKGWQTIVFDTHYQFHASAKAIEFLDAHLAKLVEAFKSDH